jgi:hypothetical protein
LLGGFRDVHLCFDLVLAGGIRSVVNLPSMGLFPGVSAIWSNFSVGRSVSWVGQPSISDAGPT